MMPKTTIPWKRKALKKRMDVSGAPGYDLAITQQKSCNCKLWSVRVLMWQMQARALCLTAHTGRRYSWRWSAAKGAERSFVPVEIFDMKVLHHPQSVHLVDSTFWPVSHTVSEQLSTHSQLLRIILPGGAPLHWSSLARHMLPIGVPSPNPAPWT